MKAVIFAAGFNTRFRDSALKDKEYRHLADTPKALLPVAGKPAIEHIIAKLLEVKGLSGLIIVTNHIAYPLFEQWKQGYKGSIGITLIDDLATTNENRKGAIRDIAIGVGRDPDFDTPYIKEEPVFAMPGDRLFEFSLNEMVKLYNRQRSTIVLSYDCGDLAKVKKSSQITTGKDGLVTRFVEKPELPTATTICPCIYLLAPHTLDKLQFYFEDKQPSDPVGRLIMWLYSKEHLHAYQAKGYMLDLGSLESYRQAQKFFGGKA